MIEPKHITDDQLLGWIRDGTIFIDRIDTRSPRVFFNGYQLKPELIKQAGYKRRVEHNGTGSERWTIRFTNKGKRRRIVRSKLVFMYANDQTIPIGHEVDHEDEDRFNDSALNLTLMDLDAHLEKHYGKF